LCHRRRIPFPPRNCVEHLDYETAEAASRASRHSRRFTFKRRAASACAVS
jgi:hypothetical protein